MKINQFVIKPRSELKYADIWFDIDLNAKGPVDKLLTIALLIIIGEYSAKYL